MSNRKVYNRFPLRVIIIRQLILLLFLGSAFASLYFFSPLALITYLGYTGILIGVILKTACTRCDYYGSVCDLGASVIVTRLFKRKSDNGEFTCIAGKSIPWLIVLAAVPLVTGILNLAAGLSFKNVLLLSSYIIACILFAVTSLKVTCPHCMMLEKCPFAGAVRKTKIDS
jgi:hypothetical protein